MVSVLQWWAWDQQQGPDSVAKKGGRHRLWPGSKTLAEIKDARSLEQMGIDLVLGERYLQDLADYDCVFVSPPGVPRGLAQLQKIQELGRLSSEIEMVFRYSRAPIFAVTGSSGKTTTTSLIRDMLRAGGASVFAGGEISVSP